MTVDFYTCTCDNRVVDKTNYLSEPITKTLQVFEQTGVFHPTLLLNYSADVVNCNYFYIHEWNRYYYIVGMEVMTGSRMTVTGSEDVLYSNKNEIMNLPAYVVRTESNKENKLIVDNKKPVQANRRCHTILFPNQLLDGVDTDRVYLLTVVGGSAAST